MATANQALLLCAGLGSRLRPLTNFIPKCLAPISGIPLLEIWLARLVSKGFDRIVINVHHHKELVIDFLVDSPWHSRVTLVDEVELLGTAGTLKANANLFDRKSPILLAHGDNLTAFDVTDFSRCHFNRPANTDITMLSFITDNPQSCGIVECDETQILRGFYEKLRDPPGNVANGAVYILDQNVVDFVCELPGDVLDFSTQVIPRFLGRIFVYSNRLYHRDIGTMQSWRMSQQEFPRYALPPRRKESYAGYFRTPEKLGKLLGANSDPAGSYLLDPLESSSLKASI